MRGKPDQHLLENLSFALGEPVGSRDQRRDLEGLSQLQDDRDLARRVVAGVESGGVDDQPAARRRPQPGSWHRRGARGVLFERQKGRRGGQDWSRQLAALGPARLHLGQPVTRPRCDGNRTQLVVEKDQTGRLGALALRRILQEESFAQALAQMRREISDKAQLLLSEPTRLPAAMNSEEAPTAP